MLKFKHIIILCIVLCASCFAASAHTEYADSLFHAYIQSEQLKDSTHRDSIIHTIFQAKELQLKDEHSNAINLLYKMLWDSNNKDDKQYYALAHYMIYQSYYKLQQYNDAINAIEVASQLEPNNTLYLKCYALMLQGFQQYHNAAIQFQRLNQLKPYNTENIYTLCNLYIQTKQYKKAHKELDKYEKLEDESVESIAIRASILKYSNKAHKIEQLFLKYIARHPEDYYNASCVLKNVYVDENQYDKAFNLLNSLNQKYPNDANILLSLAEYYKTIDNDSLHEQYTIDAINTTDLTANKAIQLTRPFLSGYLHDNDSIGLNKTLAQLNSIYPNDIAVLELQSDIYKSQLDTTRWKQILYRIREIKDDENIDLELVKIFNAQNNREEVINLTKEGYHKFNTDQWAFFHLVSLQQNQLTDSLFAEAARILPSITNPNFKSLIYQIVGDTYSLINNETLAMQMYDSCLVYNANNANVLNNVAYNITKQPNPDLKKAEKMAAKALELEPDNTYIIDTYAWILFLLGDNFLSEFYFEKLIRLENTNDSEPNIETLYHIGCLYIKTNRIDKAKVLWKKALDIYNQNPDNFKEKEIIQTIITFFENNEN